MKHWMFLTLGLLITGQVFADPNLKTALEENLYYQYQKEILSSEKSVNKSFKAFSKFEQVLFVNALEDLIAERRPGALTALDNVNPFHYELAEQLRVALLKLSNRRVRALPAELVTQLEAALTSGQFDLKVIYLLASYEAQIKRAGHTKLLNLAKGFPEYLELNKTKRIASDAAIRDLFYRSPDLESIMDGKYAGGVKLFKFCRTNRLYPCLMVMRDARGEVVRNADGSIWTHKSLASAKNGLPSYNRNGNTPTGVLTIDSVMPSADQPASFGKFRRLILNFVPQTEKDVLLQSTLPETARQEEWWKASSVARDIGRDLLRIHGTGRKNEDAKSTWWPFLQTSGCIAQRENTYGSQTFTDQRILLDTMMKAMDLTPNYANETKLKGILYFAEIDSKDAPVTVEDLHEKGIQ